MTLPLRAVNPPLTGAALVAWARDFTPRFGVDLIEEIRDFGRTFLLPFALDEWSIQDVSDCFAFLAKALDERGLLDIPPEAREQMDRTIDRCKVRDLQVPDPGPLTLQTRDPLLEKKKEILFYLRDLYQAEHRKDPTEADAWKYLLTRCEAHRIVRPDSLRNLHRREHVRMILSILKEDLMEMNKL